MDKVKNDYAEIMRNRIENRESDIDDFPAFVDGAAAMLLLIVLWLITAFVLSI